MISRDMPNKLASREVGMVYYRLVIKSPVTHYYYFKTKDEKKADIKTYAANYANELYRASNYSKKFPIIIDVERVLRVMEDGRTVDWRLAKVNINKFYLELENGMYHNTIRRRGKGK